MVREYKYSGELVQRQVLGGIEEIPVGWFRASGSQGGAAARERRRDRRMQPMQQPMQQFYVPPMQPMQPGMSSMQPGMQVPMSYPGIQPNMVQMQPPWGPMMQVPQQPMQQHPTPIVPIPAAPHNEKPWSGPGNWRRNNWSKGSWAKADDDAVVGKQWNQARTARLLLAVQIGAVYGITKTSDLLLRWCFKCKLKQYIGKEFCTTPWCRLPQGVQIQAEALAT